MFISSSKPHYDYFMKTKMFYFFNDILLYCLKTCLMQPITCTEE